MDFQNNQHNEENIINKNLNNEQIYNEVHHEELKPNFTRAELNSAILPKKIAKEIRYEKYRIFFINFISIILLVVSLFFILDYYLANPVINETTNEVTKWLVPIKYVPLPGFMFVVLAIGLIMFILSLIQYAHVITSVNSYKGDILMNKQSIPYFLIKDYKSLISRTVYLNWISISIYILSGIIIGIFFAIKGITHESYNTELIIMYCILGVTFLAHVVSLISIKYRKGNLNSYFGREVISTEEARIISKKANKVCLVTFLIVIGIILVFIVIPYLIIRKRKGLPLIPKL